MRNNAHRSSKRIDGARNANGVTRIIPAWYGVTRNARSNQTAINK